ncbi:uncharacterized protein G2W53_017582 [Senna tora]|uniref:Uncharacterized protein n=1 Tax=Senna tora TaxID=362788 RepID=A0A834TQ90_9FABA|nr:uncharacterized protein G2W53_017582 [Senna tora]
MEKVPSPKGLNTFTTSSRFRNMVSARAPSNALVLEIRERSIHTNNYLRLSHRYPTIAEEGRLMNQGQSFLSLARCRGVRSKAMQGSFLRIDMGD